jgi:hypothetical protein
MEKNTPRWLDFLSAGLLLTALGTVAMRLRATEWTPNLGLIELLTFLGGVIGLVLGYSRFSGGWARLMGLLYTLAVVPMQIALVFENGPGEWWGRANNLYSRLYYSVYDLFRNKPVQDPLLFVVIMAIFFWTIAILAGYQLTRHAKPWAPIVVAGLGLLIVDFYTPYVDFRDRYSGVFVFIILFLIARLYYLHSRREWNEKGWSVDPAIGFDMGRSVAVSGLILVMVAWNIPSMVDALTPGTEVQRQLANQWETFRDRIQNAVAGLQSKAVATNDFFGSALNLGVGGYRDNEKVFSVDLTQEPPPGVRFYWRARGYDTYTGSQWSTTQDKITSIGANEWPIQYPDWKGRINVDLTFHSLQNSMRNFYLPAFPLSISKPADVIARVNPDKSMEFVGALSNPAIRSGEQFTAKVWISQPTVKDLRAASTQYAAAVKQTYLQLPDNFNRRIRSLATQITAGQQTQYDRVMTITTWLRKNITYQTTIENVPTGRDPIEWFLFDYKKGFCNYYASAEVLMLRSIGIPARLAVGYAEGDYDEAKNSFTVLRRDSHAWPEVYFEGYGWIEFEPTAALPETIMLESAPVVVPSGRPTPDLALTLAADQPDGPERQPAKGQSPIISDQTPPAILVIVSGGAVLVLLALFFWLRRGGRIVLFRAPVPVMIESTLEKRGWMIPDWLKQWARLSELSPIERMYYRMGWNLPLLGRKSISNQTPSERLQELSIALPEAAVPISEFLLEYQLAEYSPVPYDLARARLASQKIWRITLRALFHRIVKS